MSIKMSADQQYILQNFIKTEYPDLVKGARFIKQAASIKFWAIDPQGISSENVARMVSLRLQKVHRVAATVLTVQVGVSYRGAPPSLVIRLVEARELRLLPFDTGDFERAPPPEVAARYRKGAKDEDAKPELTTKVTSLPVPVATLRQWKSALAMLRSEAGRTTMEQVARVEQEMDAYLKVANGKL